MSIFCNIYVVDKKNNWFCKKFEEKFQLTTPYWSMFSSLLHLVGLRPRVYYTLTNFRGGGKAPLPPPQYANGPNTGAYAGFLRGGGPTLKFLGIWIYMPRSGMSRAAKLRAFPRWVWGHAPPRKFLKMVQFRAF